jgi:hypothetical protein
LRSSCVSNPRAGNDGARRRRYERSIDSHQSQPMFVWLNAHRTETTKAAKPRASSRSSAVPIRRTRPPARTHAAPKADAFSGHADGPVVGPESARRHLFSARRDLARQSRAAVRRAGWRRSQRMPFRRLRPGGVLRPAEVGTYRISLVAIGRCNEHRPGVHACRPGAGQERHSESAAASAAARGPSSAMSWSSSAGVRMS